MKRILIILPTYNEAANIGRLIEEIFEVGHKASGYAYEVLVVDSHSPDKTAKIVTRIQKKEKLLHLTHEPRRGLGRAYIKGMKTGLKIKPYLALVLMDADFSHSPHHIPLLIKSLEEGNDYVIGSRYIYGGVTEDWPVSRSAKSRLANSFARLMLDMKDDVRDLTGGFKAIRVSALKQIDLDGLKASGFVFQVSLLHEFSKKGRKIVEVPISFKNRQRGRSKMRTRDIAEFLYLTYRLNPNSRIRRIIRFGFVGASGTVVNLAVLIVLVHYFSLSPPLAFAVALETSIVSNFFLNHFYTFRASITSPRSNRRDSLKSLLTKLFKYNLVALGGAAISFVVFYGLYRLGLHYIPSDLAAIIVAMSWNYYMSVRLVWKLIDE